MREKDSETKSSTIQVTESQEEKTLTDTQNGVEIPLEGEIIAETPEMTEIQTLQQQLKEAESQIAELKEQWLRSAADFKNYKRRIEKEHEELRRSSNANLILKFLPIVDDFERAMDNVPNEILETAWWSGIRMIAQKFSVLLESEGVTPIEALGQRFDANLHHAVMYEEAEGQDEQVIAVLSTGYKLHDRVLRPATVKVGKNP